MDSILSSRFMPQADEYRHAGDNYQLYTMLMRFARQASSLASSGCITFTMLSLNLPWAASGLAPCLLIVPMLLCSLVLETIPRHAKFSGQPPEHVRLKRVSTVPVVSSHWHPAFLESPGCRLPTIVPLSLQKAEHQAALIEYQQHPAEKQLYAAAAAEHLDARAGAPGDGPRPSLQSHWIRGS